jgi:aspartyl-tRNA(Asn)/glutamyl-tRNA(Gln) amidotransferase subunit B
MKIGLEMHFQLPTKSKLFCSCSTEGAEPNTHICPTCLGFPGSRPVLNRSALEYGLMITKFLNCELHDRIWFSRKTYFYPDLPKNFQITMYESPLGEHGYYELNGKRIGIWRVHIEEDPGRIKRVGRSGDEVSLIDYNRSGVPLVEIVTAPDMSSPAEARDFVAELLVELRHLVGLSASDEQVARCDANISVGKERVEVKNILGLKNLERALNYEVSRQTKMIAAGKDVILETRAFDEERKVTMPARKKEMEEEYGYIGEPDLGEYNIGEFARGLVLPETPVRRAYRFQQQYGINAVTAKQIVNTSWGMADLFEHLCVRLEPERVVPKILGPITSNWSSIEQRLDDNMRSQICSVIEDDINGKITDSEARRSIAVIAEGGDHVIGEKVVVEDELVRSVNEFLDAHPETVKDAKANPKAANSVIGHVMKATKGKFQSKEIVEAVRKELEKRP